MMVIVQIMVFWVVALSSLVSEYQHLGEHATSIFRVKVGMMITLSL
jgi:hypothetical protein